MLKRINDALPGLVIGILIYGAVLEVAGLFFVEDKLHHTVGALTGTALACFMAIHMAIVIRDVADLGNADGAKKLSVRKSVLRYLIVAVVIFAIAKWRLGNLVSLFLGVLGLKISAYLQPLINKLKQ
ncbi:MAG: hypothetical protein ACI4DR_07600 [Roseburia sp.]